MATLNTRRQTDSGGASSAPGPSNPRQRTSPGVGTQRDADAAKATGVRHGRGEICQAAPPDRRHPEDASASEGANREVHPAVFVLDEHGHPLDPCHPARARRLLASGRAVVHRHTPFVVRLRDRVAADSTVQGAEVGIDPGSQHTGIAVFTERDANRTGLYSIQLDHRGGQIRDKLASRCGVAPWAPVTEPALPRPALQQPHQAKGVARAVSETPRGHNDVVGIAAHPMGVVAGPDRHRPACHHRLGRTHEVESVAHRCGEVAHVGRAARRRTGPRHHLAAHGAGR